MRIEYQGQIHDFPDDFTDAEIAKALSSDTDAELASETAKVKAQLGPGPQVPMYGADEKPVTPEDRARANIAERRQKAEFQASRTPGERLSNTIGFASSLPVRLATKGEYGAGDIAAAVGAPQLAQTIRHNEAGFAGANQPALETAAAIGDVGAGIPGFSTMGAAGSGLTALKSAAAMGPRATIAKTLSAAAETPKTLAKGYEDIIFGPSRAGQGGGTALYSNPLIPPGGANSIPALAGAPPAMPATGPGTRIPARGMFTATRDEAIAAGERLGVPLPRGIVGNRIETGVAGALEGIPYAGEPLVSAYERTLARLGEVTDEATGRLGAPGAQGAGSAIKTTLSNWMKDATALDDTKISDLYDAVDKQIKPNVAVNLSNVRKLYNRYMRLKAGSTTDAYDAALAEMEPMLSQKKFPQGMSYEQLKEKRTGVISKLSGDVVPQAGTSQRALEAVRKAITGDMEFAVQRAGGKKALAAWKEANAAASNVAAKREIITDLIGKDAGKAPERIISRIREMTSRTAGNANMSSFRVLWRHLGEEERGNVAATLMHDLGRGPKTDDFSGARFLTGYGKMSEAAKRLVLGEAKQHYDDIARVASRIQKFEGRINYSRTGGVNAILKVIMNPLTVVSAGAGMAVNPVAGAGMAATGLGALGGLKTGRAMAHYLAKPAVASEASKMFKAYVRLQTRGNQGAEAAARNGAAFKAATQSYSQALAKETGGDPKDIEAKIQNAINENSLFRGGGEQ